MRRRIRPPRLAFLVPGGALFLASCGAGVAGVVAASGGGGGSGNSAPSITDLAVPVSRTSPARIRFALSDAEGESVAVELWARVPLSGGGLRDPERLTAVMGPEFPQNGARIQVPPRNQPRVVEVDWRFPDESFLPDDGRFVEGLQLLARLDTGAELVLGDDEPFSLGNDAPRVTGTPRPVFEPGAAEVSGIARIEVTVADSSDDVVDVLAEFDVQGDEPDASWRPATGFGLDDLQVPRAGTTRSFFWDTNADLGDLERVVKLRFTPDDGTADGDPGVTEPPFAVDNNAPPVASLHNDVLITNPDETRGIPIPIEVVDAESDPVRVLLQWRGPGEAFPDLSAFTPAELRVLLDDPAHSAERRELHVCTEMPLRFEGRLGPPPAGLEPATHATLPELASSAAGLLARDLERGAARLLAGATLEIQRSSAEFEPVVARWSDPAPSLSGAVAILPVESGPTALVLDSSEEGGWRLRELDLASGAVPEGIEGAHVATGPGQPSAMAYEPDERSVVLASSDPGGTWRIQRVELERWTVVELVTALAAPAELAGRVNGIASLGSGAALITVGSSLVRLDFADARGPAPGGEIALGSTGSDLPRIVTLLDDLETPWGVALDPLQANRIVLAERDAARADGSFGRVSTLELDTYVKRPVFVDPRTPLGAGLERPTAIAMERHGARLLALTDANPSDGTQELRGIDIGGVEPGVVFELAGSVPPAVGLAVGPEDMRLLALEDELWIAGGIAQRRTLVEYQPASLTVTVSEPFEPAPLVGAPWRMESFLGPARSAPSGQQNVFLWDSADVLDGEVHLRILPLDTDVGLDDEGLAPKRVRAFEDPLVLGDESGWIDVQVADVDGDGRQDLVSAKGNVLDVPHPLLVYLGRAGGRFDALPDLALRDNRFRNPQQHVVADLSGDGLLDVASGQTGQTGPAGGPTGIPIFIQPQGGFLPTTDAANPVLGTASSSIDWIFGLAAADLNRDGDLDLVSTNTRIIPASGQVNNLALFYQPDEGFQDGAAPDETLSTLSEAQAGYLLIGDLGDLNADGWIDLVASTSSDSGGTFPRRWMASVFLQGPVGGFAREPEPLFRLDWLSGEFASAGVEAADLDRDGRLDLAAVLNVGLFVFHQKGGPVGRYSAIPDVVLADPRVDGMGYPSASDIDGDGRLDLLAGAIVSDGVAVFLQHEGGGFSSGASAVLPVPRPLPAKAADLDGDGRPDIAVDISLTGPRHLAVLMQEARGGFAPAPDLELGTSALTDRPMAVVAGDLDGDGRNDLASPNRENDNLTLFFQTASGGFEAAPEVVLGSPSSTDEPRALAAADLDGDGRLDLASGNGNSLSLFFQPANGFQDGDPERVLVADAIQTPTSVLAVDIDGDGRIDLASSNRLTNGLALFMQTPARSFDAAPVLLGSFATTRDAYSAAAADLDRDGRIDLVVVNTRFDLAVFFQPEGGFAQHAPVPDLILDSGASRSLRDPGKSQVVAADLNADGREDLALPLFIANRLAVFLQPDLGFQDASRPDLEPGDGSLRLRHPSDLVAEDLDGDGLLDLACSSLGGIGSLNVAVFFQRSRGRFSDAPDLDLGGAEGRDEGYMALAAADLNSDGEPDIAAALQRFADPSGSEGPSDVIHLFFGGK